jgi:hypothetical protein
MDRGVEHERTGDGAGSGGLVALRLRRGGGLVRGGAQAAEAMIHPLLLDLFWLPYVIIVQAGFEER